MNEYLMAVKDIVLVLSPILVAYISYRSNKKTKDDIRLEIEKSLKEKDAETYHMIQKINAELESQKQISTWNNVIPQTNEYTNLAGPERYGNICALKQLVGDIQSYIDSNNLSSEQLQEIKTLLGRINLPKDGESLFAYEIPYLIGFNELIKKIDNMILYNNESVNS